MVTDEELLNKAKELGAIDAKIISPELIEVAHWVRLKCRYGCPDYGKWKTCPPYTPDAEEMKKILSEYKKAIIMISNSHDNATKLARDMMFFLYSKGIFKAFPLGSGRCRLCDVCTPENCKYPELAYPSMEACSIDVFTTVKRCGWENIYSKDHVPHFCLVLIY